MTTVSDEIIINKKKLILNFNGTLEQKKWTTYMNSGDFINEVRLMERLEVPEEIAYIIIFKSWQQGWKAARSFRGKKKDKE